MLQEFPREEFELIALWTRACGRDLPEVNRGHGFADWNEG